MKVYFLGGLSALHMDWFKCVAVDVHPVCFTHILPPWPWKRFVICQLAVRRQCPGSPHQLFGNCIPNNIYHIISSPLKQTPQPQTGHENWGDSIPFVCPLSIHHDLHNKYWRGNSAREMMKPYTLVRLLLYLSHHWFHSDLAFWSIYQPSIASYLSVR